MYFCFRISCALIYVFQPTYTVFLVCLFLPAYKFLSIYKLHVSILDGVSVSSRVASVHVSILDDVSVSSTITLSPNLFW